MSKTRNEMAFTKREAEILKYIAEGKTSKTIGETLFITKQTIDKHIQNMRKKFGAKNRLEMIQRYSKITSQ